MPRVRTTASPSTELHYADLGSGQPVVLIHGWPLSHRMWESQITALCDGGYRCIAYDRRGFGESGKPGGGYDYDSFASDLNDLMTQLDVHDAALVGFSMGGGEVARYVGRYGTGRVAKAALLSSVTPFLLKTADNPNGVDRAVFDGMIESAKADRVQFLEQFLPNYYNYEPGIGLSADLLPFSKWIAWNASALATVECIRPTSARTSTGWRSRRSWRTATATASCRSRSRASSHTNGSRAAASRSSKAHRTASPRRTGSS